MALPAKWLARLLSWTGSIGGLFRASRVWVFFECARFGGSGLCSKAGSPRQPGRSVLVVSLVRAPFQARPLELRLARPLVPGPQCFLCCGVSFAAGTLEACLGRSRFLRLAAGTSECLLWPCWEFVCL